MPIKPRNIMKTPIVLFIISLRYCIKQFELRLFPKSIQVYI